MISLAMWLVTLWICFGVGASVLRRLRAEPGGLAEELPLAAAMGMGLLAYLVLGVGLLGHLGPWAMGGLLALLALAGRRHMLRLARGVPSIVSAAAPRRSAAVPLSFFLIVMLILTLLGALAPAGDSDYDSLVYHLTIPKIYLQDGGIHSIPWLTHSNFPFTLEMLYTLGLSLRDQSLAKLFHFGCGWLTLCAVFAYGRRWWGERAGWIGAAVFAAIPIVAWQMMTAYIELGVALYAFLAVCALSRWFEERARGGGQGWLWVAALMCGWGLGVKMLAGVVLIFAVGALAWGLRTAPDKGRGVRQVAVFALIAAAIGAPWYVKSYLWTGNPVYPFFFEVFGGRYWTADRAALYTEAQKVFGLGTGPLDFLALPWNLTMRSRWFFDQPEVLRPFNVYVLVFGPLLLAFLPALPAAGPLGGFGRLSLWFALVFAAVWFGLTQNGRYLIPILPGLSACAGLAAARLIERRGLAAAAAGVALSLGLVMGLYPTVLLAAPAARVALGLESRSAYLGRVSETYRTFRAVEEATPPEARIFILGDEPRTFYLNRRYLLGNHAEIFSSEDLASAGALVGALKGMGVTHLLIHETTLRDVGARSGALERLIADLAAAQRIRYVGTYGKLSLWEIAGEDSARA